MNFPEIKNIRLSKEEKEQIKNNLRVFVEKHPVRNPAPARLVWQRSLLTNLKINIKPMPLVIILALVFGGSTTWAAEQSLPGDVLYPVKVNVNERVVTALAIGEEAKANAEVKLAEKRLVEIEELSVRGQLDAEVKEELEAAFEEHASKVEDRIQKFEEKENFKAAADVAANFEVSLRAHEDVLKRLAVLAASDNTDTQMPSDVAPNRRGDGDAVIDAKFEHSLKVADRVKTAEAIRIKAETKFLERKPEGDDEKHASVVREVLKDAENALERATKQYREHQAKLDADFSAKMEASLKAAGEGIVQGKAKIQAEAYREAVVTLNRSINLSKEVLASIDRYLNVDAKVRTNFNLEKTIDKRIDKMVPLR